MIQTLIKVKSDPVAGQRPSTAQPLYKNKDVFFFPFLLDGSNPSYDGNVNVFIVSFCYRSDVFIYATATKCQIQGCRDTQVYVSFHLWIYTADWRAITVRYLPDKSAVHVGGTRRAK